MGAQRGDLDRELQLTSVPDDELLQRLGEILRQSRQDEAILVAHIGEVEARRLYAREAVSSMFAYCIEVLHLSEPEAVLRIRVARASRKHPMLLTMLRDGRLHLSGIALLAPLLTPGNRRTLLKRATHKSKRQIEEMVAALQPRPEARAMMRKLPTRRHQTSSPASVPAQSSDTLGVLAPSRVPGTAGASDSPLRPGAGEKVAPQRRGDATADAGGGPCSESAAAPTALLCPDTVAPASAPRGAVEPVAEDRYRVHFTASAALRDKLERLQDLMRSSVPDGDLGAIIEEAVTEKLERLESKRFAKTRSPRKSLAKANTTPSSRHIPAPVRRAVYERDKGRCTFVDAHGKRCRARDRLEFHHRLPFGKGGDHSLKNLCLMCRAHNDLLAELDFGREKMAAHRRPAGSVIEPRVVGSKARQASRRPRGSPSGYAPGL